jgi:hypothetical protein
LKKSARQEAKKQIRELYGKLEWKIYWTN